MGLTFVFLWVFVLFINLNIKQNFQPHLKYFEILFKRSTISVNWGRKHMNVFFLSVICFMFKYLTFLFVILRSLGTVRHSADEQQFVVCVVETGVQRVKESLINHSQELSNNVEESLRAPRVRSELTLKQLDKSLWSCSRYITKRSRQSVSEIQQSRLHYSTNLLVSC